MIFNPPRVITQAVEAVFYFHAFLYFQGKISSNKALVSHFKGTIEAFMARERDPETTDPTDALVIKFLKSNYKSGAYLPNLIKHYEEDTRSPRPNYKPFFKVGAVLNILEAPMKGGSINRNLINRSQAGLRLKGMNRGVQLITDQARPQELF